MTKHLFFYSHSTYFLLLILFVQFPLKQQLVFAKASSDSLESQVGQVSKEHEASKSEVKEVLQALEELAVNYDQKLQEVDIKTKDNEKLLEELNIKQSELNKVSKDLDQVQDTLHIMKKKVTEITNTLLTELVSFKNSNCGLLKRNPPPSNWLALGNSAVAQDDPIWLFY